MYTCYSMYTYMYTCAIATLFAHLLPKDAYVSLAYMHASATDSEIIIKCHNIIISFDFIKIILRVTQRRKELAE